MQGQAQTVAGRSILSNAHQTLKVDMNAWRAQLVAERSPDLEHAGPLFGLADRKT